MSSRKLNVLVYTGTGTTAECVRHALMTLRRLLHPNYAVTPLTESALLKEPWAQTCALLVLPGGGDLGYCRVLDGAGNRRITDFVRRGGRFLGFCAGGYFGSSRCEFEVGSSEKGMEVVGRRELGFFPGTCRGGAFAGFRYHSEDGAQAVEISVEEGAFTETMGAPKRTKSYYNGGGVFVDAAKLKGKGVEVLASYTGDIDVDGGDGQAAVVYCKVGDGGVVLTGPHPEFAAANLHRIPSNPRYDQLIENLTQDDLPRSAFIKACLRKLGLEVNDEDADIPSLTAMHLTSINHKEVEELIDALGDVVTLEDNEEYIRDEADTFHIDRDGKWSMKALAEALPNPDDPAKGKLSADGRYIDYSDVIKEIVPHERAWPSDEITPAFQHSFYYGCLKAYQQMEEHASEWGNTLMYADATTSTNTIMDKNPKLLSKLPTGFTLTAATQVAARGRGSNVWVCPAGTLVFSTVINHPAHLLGSRPIVFLQYLTAVAIVEAIKSYDLGYDDVPVKLKWPNDIYARDPKSSASNPSYVKIGGILSTCSYTGGAYNLVLGIGINATNARPTTSLNALLSSNLAPFRLEKLLARILTRLESLHSHWIRNGFDSNLENRYYKHWLHSGQLVTLEEKGVRAKVVGITKDWGMLQAVEVDGVTGRETGRMWALQSDENSFDFWRGLVRRKV
ncbi:Biotin--protein ligase like [Verticillium longisporum]|uniref:Biotin--protein ligase like n=1 Tax=Verticillium longisporum TaxID=100787 RepID=A0A8I3A289_VERLO|nr:Biotin--protein ligase like [Verticillium longisporum]